MVFLRSFLKVAAVVTILSVGSSCGKGRLADPLPPSTNPVTPATGIDPVEARGLVVGGVTNTRRHTSIVGISKTQTVLTSPSYRIIGNLQGAIYADPGP